MRSNKDNKMSSATASGGDGGGGGASRFSTRKVGDMGYYYVVYVFSLWVATKRRRHQSIWEMQALR